MTRNLDKRVETIAPVTDPALREVLSTILETMLADNRNCWEMESDGRYHQRRPGDEPAVATQDVLMRRASRLTDT